MKCSERTNSVKRYHCDSVEKESKYLSYKHKYAKISKIIQMKYGVLIENAPKLKIKIIKPFSFSFKITLFSLR